MINYIAIFIAFLTGAIPLVRDLKKNQSDYKAAEKGTSEKKRHLNTILFNTVLITCLLAASLVSFFKQLEDDNSEIQKMSEQRKGLDTTLASLQTILKKSEHLLSAQNEARVELQEQLDTTKLVLNNSRENLNKTDKALLEFNRLNNDLKQMKVSFTIYYPYEDPSYKSWFTHSSPEEVPAVLKSHLPNYKGQGLSYRGQFIGGNYLKANEVAYMGRNTCIVTQLGRKDTSISWLAIFGTTYPTMARPDSTIYDKYFPWGERLSLSFQKKLAKTNDKEKYWDFIKWSDLLLEPKVVNNDVRVDVLYREMNFNTKEVRQDVEIELSREISNNSIKSLIDLNNVYIVIYKGTLAKSRITNLVLSMGEDYSNRILLDPYLIKQTENKDINKLVYHLKAKK